MSYINQETRSHFVEKNYIYNKRKAFELYEVRMNNIGLARMMAKIDGSDKAHYSAATGHGWTHSGTWKHQGSEPMK